MPARGASTNRLAVWTHTSDIDEVACGHPGVGDDERVAGGRPTLSALEREVRDRNRERALDRGRAPGALPDGRDVARVWWPRDPAAIRARLGDDALTVWAEADVLHVVWHGTAEKVELFSGISTALWPVPGTDDLWEASLRIRELDRVAVSLGVVVAPPADPARVGQLTVPAVWRGPAAPPRTPEARPLRGALADYTVDSAALRAERDLTVYLPPPGLPSTGPVRGCVLADGQALEHYAPALEHAMRAGVLAPTAVVGVHTVVDAVDEPGAAPVWPDTRTREYIPGEDRRRFAAHLRFVADEVPAWVRRELDLDVETWTTAGVSNGAVWAIAAAQRRPEVFPQVVALSPGMPPRRVSGRARAAGVRHYLAAGRLEPPFLRATREWHQRLRRARLDVRLDEVAGGHDDLWWRDHLIIGLAHLDHDGRDSSQR